MDLEWILVSQQIQPTLTKVAIDNKTKLFILKNYYIKKYLQQLKYII